MADIKEIEEWCKNNLFGPRFVEGIRIPMTPVQKMFLRMAVDIIVKWEDHKKDPNAKTSSKIHS